MKTLALLLTLAPFAAHAETTCHTSDYPALSGANAVSVIQRDCRAGDSIVFQVAGLACDGPRCTESLIPTLCTRPARIGNYGYVVCTYRGKR